MNLKEFFIEDSKIDILTREEKEKILSFLLMILINLKVES